MTEWSFGQLKTIVVLFEVTDFGDGYSSCAEGLMAKWGQAGGSEGVEVQVKRVISRGHENPVVSVVISLLLPSQMTA